MRCMLVVLVSFFFAGSPCFLLDVDVEEDMRLNAAFGWLYLASKAATARAGRQVHAVVRKGSTNQ